jgi:hypothetical protein
LAQSSVANPLSHYQLSPSRCYLSTLRLLGTIGGLAVLCLAGSGPPISRKRGAPKIPEACRASGPMCLFDSQEGRPGPEVEEPAIVKHPPLYVRRFPYFPSQRFSRGWLSFEDLTNPATFSQIHAESERPLQPGGRTQAWGTMPTNRITLGNPSAHRTAIVPGTVGFLKHTNPFITSTHTAQRSTHKTQCPFTTTTRPSRHEKH